MGAILRSDAGYPEGPVIFSNAMPVQLCIQRGTGASAVPNVQLILWVPHVWRLWAPVPMFWVTSVDKRVVSLNYAL